MKLCLNNTDLGLFNDLTRIQENNGRMLRLLSRYLSMRPRWVTAADMDVVTACGVTEEQAYTALLGVGMGLDEAETPADRLFSLDYVAPAVRQLDAEDYRANSYYRNIRIPEKQTGFWSLGCKEYAPYETFMRGDIRLEEDFREIPQLGFFSERFSYPAVFENGREWMTVTPNEIETMRTAVEHAKGSVLAFGLGLGYFAYMASEKAEVSRVTVVERDRDAIGLFREHILPQFGHAEKICIVEADAFDYAETGMPNLKPDTAFVDLWHDVSDGVDLYLRMKKLERLSPDTQFDYWIEKSILSNLRFRLFWRLEELLRTGECEEIDILAGGNKISCFEEITEMLKNDYLAGLALVLARADQLSE